MMLYCIKNDLEQFFNTIQNHLISDLNTLIYIYDIKKKINEINSIDNIMTQIDENQSLVTDDIIKLLKDSVIVQEISISNLYKIRKLEFDWKVIILRYFLDSIEYQKNKDNYKKFSFDDLLQLNYDNEINKIKYKV